MMPGNEIDRLREHLPYRHLGRGCLKPVNWQTEWEPFDARVLFSLGNYSIQELHYMMASHGRERRAHNNQRTSNSSRSGQTRGGAGSQKKGDSGDDGGDGDGGDGDGDFFNHGWDNKLSHPMKVLIIYPLSPPSALLTKRFLKVGFDLLIGVLGGIISSIILKSC